MSRPRISRGDRVVDPAGRTGTVHDTDGHWATVNFDEGGHFDSPVEALRQATPAESLGSQAALHGRRAMEAAGHAAAYQAIADALEDLRSAAEGSGVSPQTVTTLNDELRRAEAEAARHTREADWHAQKAAQWASRP